MQTSSPFYETWIQPHQTLMIRSIWRVVRNQADAEDALQDALMNLWNKREGVKQHPNPKAFILRVCHNSAIDILRKRMRDAQRHTNLNMEPKVYETARDSIMDKQTVSQIQYAISQLPRHQATAVMMRIINGEEYQAIAEALDCSEATARVHVMRGKTALQNQLDGILNTK